MKRKPKSERAKLIKQLDRLWTAHIHSKFKACVICGSEKMLAAHHCVCGKGAGGYAVRWLKNNGILLCTRCHIFILHKGRWDAAWIKRYIKILDEAISIEQQQEVLDIAHRGAKFEIVDLQELIKSFDVK
jgi:hypothetical protein